MVALRKESVDRNNGVHYDNYNLHCVALRKESVDRNMVLPLPILLPVSSLSARRAWIEMAKSTPEEAKRRSLSARRAWIEMDWASVIAAMTSVALRKESVDRNS